MDGMIVKQSRKEVFVGQATKGARVNALVSRAEEGRGKTAISLG